MTILCQMRHSRERFLLELQESREAGNMTPAEFTTLCLIPELLKQKSPFQKAPLPNTFAASSPVAEFLRLFQWKGHSDRIRRSLFRWNQGHYPIVISPAIPTPVELLKIQAQGKRIVTVFNNPTDWEKDHHRKSPWEFIAHDLIHADHFFENQTCREGQMNFYQFLLQKWDHEILKLIRTHCPEQFDYLISDMNSHPQHMKQTLSALCLISWKTKLNLGLRTRLPESEELAFQKTMSQFFL